MPNGLRYCVIVLAITDCLAALARILPSIILKSTASNFNAVALPFIHIGQILNAACAPLAVAPVSLLSCLWFPPHERTRATTVAIIANNNFGQAVGFIISPYIVALPEHVPRLLYIHFGLTAIACLLALLYFPTRPPSAPSAAAELSVNNSTSRETSHNWRNFLKAIWTCLSNPAFLCLSIAGGIVNAAFNAWPSLYDVLLEPENYTETQAGK
jgi:MFS family permease